MSAPITLLWIRPDALIRADFSAAPELRSKGYWSQQRPQVGTLQELAEACLAQAPGCGKRVWVLCDDLWTQTVSVSASAVQGLDDTQLGRALSFEAEPLSGIPAMDSAVAFAPVSGGIPGQRAYWTTLVELAAREGIQNLIERAGGRLAGILHPAGLPRALSGAAHGAWRRIESWPQTTVCVTGTAHERTKIDIFAFGGAQPRGQDALANWSEKNPAPHTEWLTENDANAPLDPSWKFVNLAAQTERTAFLAAWAAELSNAKQTVPLITSAERPKSPRYHLTIGIGALAAALALCFGHWMWLTKAKKDAEAEIKRLEQPAQELAELKKKAGELEKQLLSLSAETQKYESEAQQVDVLMQRKRQQVLGLLQHLAEQRPDDLVINKISAESNTLMKVHGVSLEPALVEEMAARLSKNLLGLGWEVHPQEVQGQQSMKNGGPWQFTFDLKPSLHPGDHPGDAAKQTPKAKPRAEIIEPDATTFASGGEGRP